MSGFGLGTVGSHHQQPSVQIEDLFGPQFFDEPLPYLVRGCFSMEQFQIPASKRQKLMTNVANMPPLSAPAASSLRRKNSIHSPTTCADGPTSSPVERSAPPTSAPSKSKRVRTGCLTCRERHLKCDEAAPDCMNCRKSSRECKRGVRLNFIDVQVKDPPYIPPTVEWSVQFQDESRHIASEYQGGLNRYARRDGKPISPSRGSEVETTIRPKQKHQQTPQSVRQRPRADSMEMLGLMLDTAAAASQAPTNPSSYSFTNPNNRPPPMSADQSPYDDHHSLHSRKGSEASYLSGPPPSHPGPYSLPEQFNTIKQEQFHQIKEDIVSQSSGHTPHHGYHTSDVSNTSSLTAAATASSSSSFRQPGSGIPPDGIVTPPPSETPVGEKAFLNSPEEVLYMQVFVEEVGVWMDSLDKDKHFSRLIPYHALKSPMLLNAFLACGVKHLTLVNPSYKDDKALFYYDTATTQLLRSLQNPDRNTAECATTAVVLNVYEIMSEKPQQRMNHIAGARALIRECKWDARSKGVGAACFWLNIGMEVLSCLAFNWKTAWDPDQWGVDMDFSKGRQGCGGGGEEEEGDCTGRVGGEELWVHRIFYIVAKIANFRATIPKFQEASPHDEQARLGQRLRQWEELKSLCDTWNNQCPRTMHPFGYLDPSRTKSKSAFPNVWLIKRAAIIGRLFYHTAQCLLAQTHPMEMTQPSEETRNLQLHHAHQICGIVAHSKDRGVASVAIRSLAIASCVLTERAEQDEVLTMLDKINAETGWRLGKVTSELKRAWGWEGGRSGSLVGQVFASRGSPGQQSMQSSAQMPPQQQQQQQQQQQPVPPRRHHAQTPSVGSVTSLAASTPGNMIASTPSTVVAPAPVKAPVNPLSLGDFSLPNHPYQNWYEPPNRTGSFSQAF